MKWVEVERAEFNYCQFGAMVIQRECVESDGVLSIACQDDEPVLCLMAQVNYWFKKDRVVVKQLQEYIARYQVLNNHSRENCYGILHPVITNFIIIQLTRASQNWSSSRLTEN